MTSPMQIEANRINSLSSTGPRTAEGKQTSSRNAISHGLSSIGDPVLPHEYRDGFAAVVQAYVYEFAPETSHEIYLVNEMAGARWRIARADRLLNIVLSGCVLEAPETGDDEPEINMARLMAAKGDPIAKLERHRATWERTYYRCVHELRASQKFRSSNDPRKSPACNQQPASVQQNEPKPQPRPFSGDAKTYIRTAPKVGRNDYCPCGSGLKYKKCCLATPNVNHFGAPAA